MKKCHKERQLGLYIALCDNCTYLTLTFLMQGLGLFQLSLEGETFRFQLLSRRMTGCVTRLTEQNLEVTEGYPSRLQESGGLKIDQFVRVPKT